MKKLAAFMATLLPLFTMAHPGHGNTDGYTIIHYFLEPQHAIITLSIIAVVALIILRERKKNRL